LEVRITIKLGNQLIVLDPTKLIIKGPDGKLGSMFMYPNRGDGIQVKQIVMSNAEKN
jgi:hypothetical protein